MKKLFTVLAVAGVFTFASCESKKVEETNTTTVEGTEAEDMGTEATTTTTDSASTTTTDAAGTTTTTDSAATTTTTAPAAH